MESARDLARNVGVAIAVPAAKALLKGFNFNNRAILGSILFNPYSVATATGIITINGLVPINEVAFPPGATHMTVKGAWVRINFTTGVAQVFQTNAVNMPIDGANNNITLTPTGGK